MVLCLHNEHEKGTNMKKATKKSIAEALRNIATAIDLDADSTPDPMTTLFDYGAIGVSTNTPKEKTNEDLLNEYFHETVGKSKRTLNHSLNKVNKDWQMKSLRTPKGPRALVEVATDCSLDVKELCEMIMMHPKFSQNDIGAAATKLLEELA